MKIMMKLKTAFKLTFTYFILIIIEIICLTQSGIKNLVQGNRPGPCIFFIGHIDTILELTRASERVFFTTYEIVHIHYFTSVRESKLCAFV